MIEDADFYRKMIGLWQITKIPMLKASVIGDQIDFTWAQGAGLSLPVSMFLRLEPVEILEILEKTIEERYKINAKQWRSDLRGFTKNPLT